MINQVEGVINALQLFNDKDMFFESVCFFLIIDCNVSLQKHNCFLILRLSFFVPRTKVAGLCSSRLQPSV